MWPAGRCATLRNNSSGCVADLFGRDGHQFFEALRQVAVVVEGFDGETDQPGPVAHGQLGHRQCAVRWSRRLVCRRLDFTGIVVALSSFRIAVAAAAAVAVFVAPA